MRKYLLAKKKKRRENLDLCLFIEYEYSVRLSSFSLYLVFASFFMASYQSCDKHTQFDKVQNI